MGAANLQGESMTNTCRARSGATLAAALAASLAAAPVAAEPFKLGLVTYLSGPAAESFGVPAMKSFMGMIAELNAGTAPAPYDRKGFGGLEIVPVQLDENGGATKQVSELRNLVEREKVDAVIGYIGSSDCLAVAPAAEELKTVVVLSDCGTPRIFEEGSYDYVFRSAAVSAVDVAGMLRYFRAQGMHPGTMNLINADYAYGQDTRKEFVTAMAAAFPETKVGADLLPKFGAGQYGTEISALLREKADLTFSSLWGGDLEALILQAAPRGLFARTQTAFLSADHVLEKMGNRIPDGVIIGARGAYGQMAPPSAVNDWFRAAYAKVDAAQPTHPAYRSAQALLLVKTAVEKAMAANGGKKPSAEELAAAMKGTEWETPGGKAALSRAGGHQIAQAVAFGRTKWDAEKGVMTLVDIVHYAPECVNPPEGTKSADWLAAGFPGDCPAAGN